MCRFAGVLFAAAGQGSEAVRCAAVGVLIEMLAKRMEPAAKLALIGHLAIVPVCQQWRFGLPVDAEQGDLALCYAKLLATAVTGAPLALDQILLRVLSEQGYIF